MEHDLPSEVKPLWIEAAFTAEYERDTLPLLFASDRIFSEYYDALAQKNRSLQSAIEQVRQENFSARSYRTEGMWRESIEALMRCVELRRAVFDSADFQFVAALRHCILSMLNFASYFMKEAGTDSDSSMLSRAFELMKRAEDSCSKFTDSVDKLFFRALVENNFALYFMKRKLMKAAAQRLQLAAKSWQAIMPHGSSQQQQGGGGGGSSSPSSADGGAGFYFAVQRGVGECCCARFESGLELLKRAVAVAPQLPEEQDQQRADADHRDEQIAQGKEIKDTNDYNSSAQQQQQQHQRPAASKRNTGDSSDDDLDNTFDTNTNNNNTSTVDHTHNNNNDSSANNNNNKSGNSNKKQQQQQNRNQQVELPVQVSLQLLGVPVPVDAIAQVSLHHNVAVAFIGMRRYRDALPWATKATELLTLCKDSLPPNSSVVKIVTKCSEYCHQMGKQRGGIEYRMKRSEFHQTAHLKKFKSLHSAIKPNAGSAAFEQRRRALQNSYNEKYGEEENNNNGDDENNNNNSRGRSRSANNKSRGGLSSAGSLSLSNSMGSTTNASGNYNRQSAESLRQYLKTLSYEELVNEFGPDGKRRVDVSSSAGSKKVAQTSPRLLQLPKHRRVPVEKSPQEQQNNDEL